MIEIQSPNIYIPVGCDRKSIFLAGGITNCPDWQQQILKMMEDVSLVAYNPRRENFPIHDPNAAEAQITWEHDRFRDSDMILFWFPKDTMCPIVLYELGAWSMIKDIPIFVGVHPEYPRRQDVEVQTKLVRPDVEVVYSIQDLAEQVRKAVAK